MICIVDIGLCNLRSISKAVYGLGFDFEMASSPPQLDEATHCILPGVGAFKSAMDRLAAVGLDEAIRRFCVRGRPLLGVCLGMQLLAQQGDEGGGSPGLDLVGGRVIRLEPGGDLRVPHVGWNSVALKREHPVFADVKPGRDFYFVHSYHLSGTEPGSVLGETEHGIRFTSAVARENVVGLQFHPEKSQANGLKLLENFCAWDGRC